jgi:hypothetical protein
MLNKSQVHAGLAGFALIGGSLLALPVAASATATPHSFSNNQALLETQLANRATQLTHLGTDVTGATSLTAPHATTLKASIATATTNIDALVAKVPTDTTNAQLAVDRASMLKENRVFAVLTPQVFLTIEADSIAAQVVTFQANESSLQGSVNSLVGQHGYTNALNHYVAFVKAVNVANAAASNITTAVLAQTPADYPGDTHVFVHANRELLRADISLAHASYDESVIGLASGGYTGA